MYPVHDRVQKPVRVNREEPPGDLKEVCEPTVNPMLLYMYGTPSHAAHAGLQAR